MPLYVDNQSGKWWKHPSTCQSCGPHNHLINQLLGPAFMIMPATSPHCHLLPQSWVSHLPQAVCHKDTSLATEHQVSSATTLVAAYKTILQGMASLANILICHLHLDGLSQINCHKTSCRFSRI